MVHGLRRCYEELNETDLDLTLVLDMCNLKETKPVLTLDVYGRVNEALKVYRNLTNKMAEGGFDFNQAKKSPSAAEMTVWEDRWIVLLKDLCQRPALAEYAETTNSPKLMMEWAWISRNWAGIRTLLKSPSSATEMESGDPDTKMNEIFAAIAEGDLGQVENLQAQTAQVFLRKWQLLPGISTTCDARSSLLRNFHRLVELRESGQMMSETSAHASKMVMSPEGFKTLLNTWRDRLPNAYESFSVWEDL